MTSDPEPAVAVPSDVVADGVYRPLDARVIALDRIGGAILAACLSVVLALAVVITWLAADTEWIPRFLALAWPVATALLAWYSYVWPEISFRHASYRVDHLGIEIRHGVFWRREITVPRSRVQHIDVSQGPIERRFGLGRLSIYTAGTEYAMVGLHGVAHRRALLIRDHLLPKETQDAV